MAPEIIFTFDDKRLRGLNGSCLVSPGIMLIADCFAGLIWRVDLQAGTRRAQARVWLRHDTMLPDPDAELPPPPQAHTANSIWLKINGQRLLATWRGQSMSSNMRSCHPS